MRESKRRERGKEIEREAETDRDEAMRAVKRKTRARAAFAYMAARFKATEYFCQVRHAVSVRAGYVW